MIQRISRREVRDYLYANMEGFVRDYGRMTSRASEMREYGMPAPSVVCVLLTGKGTGKL